MITAACPRHKGIVETAMAPDAPLEAMEAFIREANDCPDCRKEESAAGGSAAEEPREWTVPRTIYHRED